MHKHHLTSLSRLFFGLIVLLAVTWPAAAQQTEKRIALVVGNGAYADNALPTTANDAGLIAQQLQAAGFDVSGARDLDGDTLRHAFRDFVDKAGQSGPDTVAVVYFAGYGLQFEGENYAVPVDARIARAADVPIQAVRVSDLLRPLAELPLKARIMVLDAARENPFAREGQPLASGLALAEPDAGTLIAFNAAPGTVAPPETGDAYSPYARALAEMMREGGLPLKDVFDQVRLRVNDLTKGAVIPWETDRVEVSFLFFDRKPDAPPPANAGLSALRDTPIRGLGAGEAYQAALGRDTVPAYQEFLDSYPRDPMAKRVRAILAARREALTWRRTLQVGTADAYWSYLRRYPRGPHLADCHRRLGQLAVVLEPPPAFEEIEYDLPPPPPEEIVIVDRPVLTFADPYFDFAPPPPVIVLAPLPPYFIDLAPPPPPVDFFVLPVPVYEPLPIWIDRPVYVEPPPVNIISYNIHNTVIVNTVQNTVIVKDPEGQPVPPFANAVAAGVLPRDAAAPFSPGANGVGAHREPQLQPGAPRISPGVAAGVGAALGAGAAAAITRAALTPLPPSVAARAEQERRPGLGAARGAVPGALGPNGRPLAPGQQALPGQQPQQPLPGRIAPLQGQGRPLAPGQQAVRPLPGQALPGQQLPQPLPGQIAPVQGQGRPLAPGQQAVRPLPGQALPGQQPLPGQTAPAQGQGRPLAPGQQAVRPLPGQALPGQQLRQPLPGQIAPAQGQGRPLAPGQQAVRPLPGQALPGQQLPGQIAPIQGQGRPIQSGALPGVPAGVPASHALPGQPLPGQVQPGRLPEARPRLPGQPAAPANPQVKPAQIQPGQTPLPPVAPGVARPGVQEQQLKQQRALQTQQQQNQQLQQQRALQTQRQHDQQLQQQRALQTQQQQNQQLQQQRALQTQQHDQQLQQQRAPQTQQQNQQLQQQRALQTQQQQNQQLQQQRALQTQRQHDQQLQQQRALQTQQQQNQQLQQQRAQQVQQQQNQQIQQQRAQQVQQQQMQVQQQRAQQMQVQREQQMQQQRAQQMQMQQQQAQQRAQQMQQMQRQHQPAPGQQCGKPGQPPCG
jgi:uncharacterized caspase-like protein